MHVPGREGAAIGLENRQRGDPLVGRIPPPRLLAARTWIDPLCRVGRRTRAICSRIRRRDRSGDGVEPGVHAHDGLLVDLDPMADVGVPLRIADRLRAFQQARRRLRVLVHRGYLEDGSVPFYFMKVTNLSSARDVVITNVWFEAAPPVHLLLPERPLPKRLRPDETWEAWIPATELAHASDVERLGRVLITAKRHNRVVKSRPNTEVPPAGS